MHKLIFALPGNESTARAISGFSNIRLGNAEIRRFPDGESYVRFSEDLKGKSIFLICTLARPDEQILPLYLAAAGARDAGAKRIVLVAPYLSYLRQDRIFKEGEVLTSKHFAQFLSSFLDGLITLDPHLHRYASLSEIYSIPAEVKKSSAHIASWIRNNIQKPLIIGPDIESRQWVEVIASETASPFLVLQKKRHGDRSVEIELPEVEKYRDFTPVLLDDIVSTGKTMAETITHLIACGMRAPVCIAVHAVFAPGSFEELKAAGAAQIVSCNTIPHVSNKIDILDLFSSLE